ncbi:MAG: hypothetical protein SCH70_01490 [Candidatus Methanoperedens sp.]|nr:hypothetical protein [Candidatus Methanoperedens sp.]
MKFVRDDNATNLISPIVIGIAVLIVFAILIIWIGSEINAVTCSNMNPDSSWYRLAGCK